MQEVAGAALAAEAARHVPGVGRAAVAVLTDHVGQAVTLPAAPVAVTVAGGRTAGRLAAQLVAHTLCGGATFTKLSDCGAPVSLYWQ